MTTASAGCDNVAHIQRLAAHLSISEPEARQRDKSARIQLLRELGQLGIETLSGYLDKPGKQARGTEQLKCKRDTHH
ncbi:MAG: hypothetical protein ACXWTY_13165 [Methylobacter sp.]